MNEFLRIASGVSTPVGLVGVLLAVAFLAYAAWLRQQQRLLQRVRPEQLATLLDHYLTRYKITAVGLSKERKFELIRDEMSQRHRRSIIRVWLAAMVFLLSLAMSVAAYIWDGVRGDSERQKLYIEIKAKEEKLTILVRGLERIDGEALALSHSAPEIAELSEQLQDLIKQYDNNFSTASVPPAERTEIKQARDILEGSGTTDVVRAMNRLKNREAIPTPLELDPMITLQAMLAPGDDANRFDQSKAATIKGIVVDVHLSGPNSANFNQTDAEHRDILIHLGQGPNDEKDSQVVAVVTPRLRKVVDEFGSAGSLRAELVGRSVVVSGWMLFNPLHVRDSKNTNHSGAKNWRATAWEIHPVTSLKVVDE